VQGPASEGGRYTRSRFTLANLVVPAVVMRTLFCGEIMSTFGIRVCVYSTFKTRQFEWPCELRN
jgi:hypothetical protein